MGRRPGQHRARPGAHEPVQRRVVAGQPARIGAIGRQDHPRVVDQKGRAADRLPPQREAHLGVVMPRDLARLPGLGDVAKDERPARQLGAMRAAEIHRAGVVVALDPDPVAPACSVAIQSLSASGRARAAWLSSKLSPRQTTVPAPVRCRSRLQPRERVARLVGGQGRLAAPHPAQRLAQMQVRHAEQVPASHQSAPEGRARSAAPARVNR